MTRTKTKSGSALTRSLLSRQSRRRRRIRAQRSALPLRVESLENRILLTLDPVPSGDITPGVWDEVDGKWESGNPAGYSEGDTTAMAVVITAGSSEVPNTVDGTWELDVCLQVHEEPFTDAYAFTGFEAWDTTFLPPHLPNPGNLQDSGIAVTGAYGGEWDTSHSSIWAYNATIVGVEPITGPALGHGLCDANYLGATIEFEITDADELQGDSWIVFGGHLADEGDSLPAGTPEGNANGIVDDGEGASNMTGTFQARIEFGTGDKTVNFRPALIGNPGKIVGSKYHDLNADGDDEGGTDPGLDNWTITAFVDANSDGILQQSEIDAGAAGSDVTAGGGLYSLTLDAGDYIVVETAQANWFESPDTDTTEVNPDELGGFGKYGYAITIADGEVVDGNDFANFQQATKSGRKYHDLNADGDDEGGTDPGLDNWTITAFVDANSDGILQQGEIDAGAAGSDVTAGGGLYSLTLDPGDYIVVETAQANWFESPDTDTTEVNPDELGGFGKYGYAITLTSGTPDSGNDFANFQQATKSGRKYHDLNADGDDEGGTDPGLDNWTITAFVDANSDGILQQGEIDAGAAGSDVTAGGGLYSLTLDPGDYIVVETAQANWFESPDTDTTEVNPDELGGFGKYGYAITLTSGTPDSGNDFANFQQATKSGRKYHDLNADGDDEGGTDPGLDNWTITAFVDANSDGILQQGEIDAGAAGSDVTAGGGLYSLTLDPGDYIVVETAQANWFESPDTDTTEVNPDELGGFGKYGYAITLTSGTPDSGNDFANFQQATKSGRKYHDLNADGDDEGGTDPGLDNWTITAFVDANSDGILQQGEIDAGAAGSDVTAGGGLYSLTLDPGDYIVVETAQANWFESPDTDTTEVNPDELGGFGKYGYAITLTSGTPDSGNDFANFQQATKSGRKYHDLNADGDDEGGTDPGLDNWTITAFVDANSDGILQQGEIDAGAAGSDVTAGGGLYSLTLDPGDYIVVETAQANWFESPDTDTTEVNPDELGGFGKYGYAITLTSGTPDSGNDFANFQQVTKSGRKYHDLNADGDDEGGTDPGLDNWTITAFVDANSDGILQQGEIDAGAAGSDVTAGGGLYSLTLDPGDYIVVETAQANWFESPDTDTTEVNPDELGGFGKYGYAITLTSGTPDDGNDFANFQQATKSGRKYHDLNADGDDEGGTDPGLDNWTITAFVDANSDGILQQSEIDAGAAGSDVTAGGGLYSLTLDPGDYIVVETAQANWFESPDTDTTEVNPDELGGFGKYGYAITLTSGTPDSGNDFANFQQATKSGRKYHDLNADGDDEGGTDPGLDNWTITAFVDANSDGILQQGEIDAGAAGSDVTAGGGLYSLTLDPGDYIVVETAQANWFESPDTDTTEVNPDELGGFGKYGYAITLSPGQVDSGNDFANFQQATKSGRKYHDLNADGDDEGGTDPGLDNWTITAFVDANSDGILQQGEIDAGAAGSDVTAGGGLYSLTLDPGDYIVVETAQANWFESPDTDTTEVNPDELGGFGKYGYAITLTSGTPDSGNDFANFQQVTKSGRKYHDLNADGDDEGGTDPGLDNWTITAFVDANSDGILQQGEIDAGAAGSDVTAGGGLYSLTLDPGDYIVVETAQANWFESPDTDTTEVNPDELGGFGKYGYAITLTSGTPDDGNDFANFQQATKSGRKYHDLNADGDDEGGTDPGLDNWTITAFVDANSDGILQQGEIDAGAAGSDVTAGGGLYSLTLDPGDYIVVETAQANWFESPDTDTTEVNPDELGGFGKYGYAITLTSGTPDDGNDFANFQTVSIHGIKFYDKVIPGNIFGQHDPGEPGVGGITIELYRNGVLVATTTTATEAEVDADPFDHITTVGQFWFENQQPGTFTVTEVLPDGWLNTTPLSSGPHVLLSGDPPLELGYVFGNIQRNDTDARTPGYWRNKHGRKIIQDMDWFDELSALNLRDKAGDDFDPANINQWRRWLQRADAENMAYMLSAQMASMYLNIHSGFVDADDVVLVQKQDGTFTTLKIGDVVDAANDLLGLDPDGDGQLVLVAGEPDAEADAITETGGTLAMFDGTLREYADFLKTILDAGNNDENFIHPCPPEEEGAAPSGTPLIADITITDDLVGEFATTFDNSITVSSLFGPVNTNSESEPVGIADTPELSAILAGAPVTRPARLTELAWAAGDFGTTVAVKEHSDAVDSVFASTLDDVLDKLMMNAVARRVFQDKH